MKKLNPTARVWLKGFHLFFICAWVGAAMCMITLNYLFHPANEYERHGVLAALKLIDDWVIIPSAVGSLLTGLLISWLTPWGFFKWRWVTLKWIGTIAVMLFGTFFLGPWLNGMEAIASADPLGAMQNPVFVSNQRMMNYAVGPQIFILIFMVLISVLKPWKLARQQEPGQRKK